MTSLCSIFFFGFSFYFFFFNFIQQSLYSRKEVNVEIASETRRLLLTSKDKINNKSDFQFTKEEYWRAPCNERTKRRSK